MTAGRHRRRLGFLTPAADDDEERPVNPVDPGPVNPDTIGRIMRGAGPTLIRPAGWCAPIGTPDRYTDERVTGVEPVEMPRDPAALAAILHGTGHPKVTGAEGAAALDAWDAVYADARVREGGIPPRWGCSTSAHEHLGWCSQCPGIDAAAELMAWRVLADGHDAPDVGWARQMTGDGR